MKAGGASSFLQDCDEAGHRVHFHALRHTFIARLARAHAPPKVAQELARHSTITLTMDRYAHVAGHDRSAALSLLPALEDIASDQHAALPEAATMQTASPVGGDHPSEPDDSESDGVHSARDARWG